MTSDVKPMNQASVLLLVVPVLPAISIPSILVFLPVPLSTAPFKIETI